MPTSFPPKRRYVTYPLCRSEARNHTIPERQSYSRVASSVGASNARKVVSQSNRAPSVLADVEEALAAAEHQEHLRQHVRI